MVKIGNKEVIFSTSFVMSKMFDNKATFSVPPYSFLEYDISVRDKSEGVASRSPEDWFNLSMEGGRQTIEFDLAPEGRSDYRSIGVALPTETFDVQVTRQGLSGRMLVHVIVVREAR